MYQATLKKQKKFVILLSFALAALGLGVLAPTPSQAAEFQFSGPSGGLVNVESGSFTILGNGNANWDFSVVFKKSDSTDASSPLTFNTQGGTPVTFTFTPQL